MSEDEPITDKLYLLNSHIQWEINQIKDCLLGRILTLIDASIEDKERRKALKDIIKQEIWKKEFFSDEINGILIEFVEKFTDISTEQLKKWSADERPPSKRGPWFDRIK